MIYIEEEVPVSFDFHHRKIIEDVINYSIDYVDCPYECEVNVILTDNENIKIINEEYRDIDLDTDVLSFPQISYKSPADFTGLEDYILDYFNPESGELILGDIIISIEKVRSQSIEYGHSESRELAFLTVHSMLHLFGYDHIEEGDRVIMEDLQKEILDNMKIFR